jgi:hypothetical protein
MARRCPDAGAIRSSAMRLLREVLADHAVFLRHRRLGAFGGGGLPASTARRIATSANISGPLPSAASRSVFMARIRAPSAVRILAPSPGFKIQRGDKTWMTPNARQCSTRPAPTSRTKLRSVIRRRDRSIRSRDGAPRPRSSTGKPSKAGVNSRPKKNASRARRSNAVPKRGTHGLSPAAPMPLPPQLRAHPDP